MILQFTLECAPDAVHCDVFFEPEGAVLELKAGEIFTVEMRGGEEPYKPEVTYFPDGIMVWAWSGAETRAWNKKGESLPI